MKNDLTDKINSLIFFEIPAQVIAAGEKARINVCCCYNGTLQKITMEFEINKSDPLIENIEKMINAIPKEPEVVIEASKKKSSRKKK